MGAGAAVVVLLIAVVLVAMFVLGVILFGTGLVARHRGNPGTVFLALGGVLLAVAVGVPLSLPIVGLVRGDQTLELDARDGTIDVDALGDAAFGDDLWQLEPDEVDVRLPSRRRLRTSADRGLTVLVRAVPRSGELRSIRISTTFTSQAAAVARVTGWREQLEIPAGDDDAPFVADDVTYEASVQPTTAGQAIPRLVIEFG